MSARRRHDCKSAAGQRCPRAALLQPPARCRWPVGPERLLPEHAEGPPSVVAQVVRGSVRNMAGNRNRPADAGIPQRHAVPNRARLRGLVPVLPVASGGGGVVNWGAMAQMAAAIGVSCVLAWALVKLEARGVHPLVLLAGLFVLAILAAGVKL